MALYRPDTTLIEATKLINNLPNSPDNLLIKYYISNLEEQIKKLTKSNKEYKEVFDGIAKFTNKREMIYR